MEIWGIIFRLAAAEPDSAFDTSSLGPLSEEPRSWNVPFTERDMTGVQNWKADTKGRCAAYSARLALRRSLVLTCKFWHYCATELLYECVVLHSLDAVLSFINALDVYELQVSGPIRTHRPSFYTKRLHLSTRSESDNHGTAGPQVDLSVHAAKFKHFESLKLLTIVRSNTERTEGIKEVVESLTEASSGQRHLSLFGVKPDIKLLEHYSQLRFLSLSKMEWNYEGSSWCNSFGSLTFHELHTLSLRQITRPDPFEWISKWHLPSLRNLGINGPLSYHPEPLFTYFAKFAPNLKSLDLSSCTMTALETPNIAPFLRLCTSLEDLTLRRTRNLNLEHVFERIPPSLARLSVEAGFEPLPDDSRIEDRRAWEVYELYPMLHSCMDDVQDWIEIVISGIPPNLKKFNCFRIVDLDPKYFQNIAWLTSDLDSWERMSAVLGSFGVRFECSSDEPIVITDDIVKRARSDAEWLKLCQEVHASGFSEEDLDEDGENEEDGEDYEDYERYG
jgi:hypothetical protein